MLAAGLLLGACASTRERAAPGVADIERRIAYALEQRGLGSDALGVIDNLLRHEQSAPPLAPPLMRELLTHPPAAVDAAAIFARAVPTALTRLVAEAKRPPGGAAPTDATRSPIDIRDLLTRYLRDLAQAQRIVRAAARQPIDAAPLLAELAHDLPGAARLGELTRNVDMAAIERSRYLFVKANTRLLRALNAAAGRLRFPERVERFDSPLGPVVIGTVGDDEYGPDAAVIVDPGGNDRYRRAPLTGGAVAVVIDLGGDDRYLGSDLVVHGLSAIIDLAGNDRYESPGPGLGAAIAGTALIVDATGDDRYRADAFAIGAAAFGLGAVIDLAGDDDYRLRMGGQGFGMTAGLGLLWDMAGNDRYSAGGQADSLDRGGGISMAQGVGYGMRTQLGGGIGILRDEAGDDSYLAELYAQGSAYYHGLGLLWDGKGNDSYRAARYAQGAGVHEAVGILRDDAGNDDYDLAVGVGQGMGLDQGVGVLFDGGGNDGYRSRIIAQGSATANGFGLAVDLDGDNRRHHSGGHQVWGGADWARGLPGLGLLLFDPARTAFFHNGEPADIDAARAVRGDVAATPAKPEPPADPACTPVDAAPPPHAETSAALLRSLMSGLIRGQADAARHGALHQRLYGDMRGVLATLAADDFETTYALGVALRCALADATPTQAATLWNEFEQVLADDPATPFAGVLLGATHARRPAAAQLERLLQGFDAHPRCGVRSGALALRTAAAFADGNVPSAATRTVIETAARKAADSPCWRLQAVGLNVLKRLDAAVPENAPLPSFLNSQAGH